MKVKVTNLVFDISEEDVIPVLAAEKNVENPNDTNYATHDLVDTVMDLYCNAGEMERDIEDRIAEIEEDLPTEIEVDIDDDTSPEDLEEAITDAVSEKTGWLLSSLSYEVV